LYNKLSDINISFQYKDNSKKLKFDQKCSKDIYNATKDFEEVQFF